MFRRGNNYGPPQGSFGYAPRTDPPVNVYVEPIAVAGYGPGYGPGYGGSFARRGGFGCDMCGSRRRCRCRGGPGLPMGLGGYRQGGLLGTVIGGAMGMIEDRHERKNEERLMMAQVRMEEDMRYARDNRGLETGTRPMQSQSQTQIRSRSAVREDGRDSYGEKDVRSDVRGRQGAVRANSEDDESDEERMDEKRGLSRDERRREERERMDEKLPSYQAATKKK
ncbi:hypothetical protein H2202_000819 [Exophiala xenobiotica]|nr:hypothetical protein H2202_000819 [Exophiala xenobiotica]KAK5195919.1 hypothetical protein LTR92_004860 [Exophiala xenobiotica]KAK5209902.1 hypothetical protein LTR41_004534 [Exophiala xenobiotica]KAK5225777.1 hypothetical protein LTR72_003680 [Exophiala xenobiotica]KAK5236068.1 hypothetical protein LTR47_002794 [Exophiala xenobiotica]